MPLTVLQVKSAQPKKKQYKLTDAVTPSGSKYWRINYRWKGKYRTHAAVGVYPEVSLAEAREAKIDLRRLLKDGIDLATNKRAGGSVGTNTFENVSR